MDDKERLRLAKEALDSGSYDKETIEYIFPELKETKDENIRKAILKHFEFVRAEERLSSCFGVDIHTIIAWLEMQGEQNPVQEIEPTLIFKIGDILKRKGKGYTFRVDRIQGGYYHCDRNHGAFFPIEEQDNWELVEQNPAWSEEDDRMLDKCIEAACSNYYPGISSVRDWLRGIKDRVQSHWKPSDEQMNALNDVISSRDIKYDVLSELWKDLKKLREE